MGGAGSDGIANLRRSALPQGLPSSLADAGVQRPDEIFSAERSHEHAVGQRANGGRDLEGCGEDDDEARPGTVRAEPGSRGFGLSGGEGENRTPDLGIMRPSL